MSDSMTKVKQWFAGLSESEQRLLKIASVLFLVVSAYYALTTMSSYTSSAKVALKNQQELNDWAAVQIDIIQNSTSSLKPKGNNSTSVTQAINVSAKRSGISIERLQPQSNDVIRVGLNEVEFKTLMNWLESLANQHDIRVMNIDVAEAQPGIVKVRRLDLGR